MPWWLRAKKDEKSYEEELPETDPLDLISVEEDKEDADDEDETRADTGRDDTGRDDKGHGSAEPEDGDEEPSEDDDDKGSRRKRRRRKPKAKSGGREKPSAKEDERPEPSRKAPAKAATKASGGERSDRRDPKSEPADEMVFGFELPERSTTVSDERKIALFCDLENIALGVRNSATRKFDINLVIERLLEKGKIIVKKAYADWERYSDYKRAFHEAAIELIDIPQKHYSGKNSADIKMVVDAMDLCYSKEHLDTFVIMSGDSDFSPLVSKLKENNKYVIGVGVKNSTSTHLIDNCDEFIYYEDVWRDLQHTPRLDHLSPKEAECFGLLIDSILALVRENKSVIWGSMLKQTMQRKRPSFSEGYYGYPAFSDLLEDASTKNIIRLKRDQRSGNYVVTGFGRQG